MKVPVDQLPLTEKDELQDIELLIVTFLYESAEPKIRSQFHTISPELEKRAILDA